MIHDFIIIGQGLAGSILAWQLYQAGAKILVIDSGYPSASRIAAGLVTPVTGKRWVKTRHIDLLLPNAYTLYQRLGHHFNQRFFFEKPLLRLFQNEADKNKALQRRHDPDYSAYLGDIQPSGAAHHGLDDPYGSIWIQQTGYLAGAILCETIHNQLVQHNAYIKDRLEFARIRIDQNHVRWGPHKTHKIVFCEGWRVIQNPWFQSLPWQPSQGDILTCHTRDSLPPFIVNCGAWVLPLGKGFFRLGATYQWQPLDEQPSQTASNHLLKQMAQMFKCPIRLTCTGHQAGIRPNTLDQQPIMGCHPRFPQLAIFNGFGSKGGLQIPYYSQCFRDFLLAGQPLPAHVTITRYHDRLTH